MQLWTIYFITWFLQVRRYRSTIIGAVIEQINHNLISNWEDQINRVDVELKFYPEGIQNKEYNMSTLVSFNID
jgi:hypothetical protein